MPHVQEIINWRKSFRHYDEELWDFIERVHGQVLGNLTDEALQLRLAHIDRNILHLDAKPGPRDDLRPEHGWLSPWYWLRLRHWTLAELRARSVEPAISIDVPPPLELRPEFIGIHAGGGKLLVRISRAPFLIDMLEQGRLRFAPASFYREIEGDRARTDDEIRKAYRRPGTMLSIRGPTGRAIEPLGDVTFTTHRAINGGSTEIPYLLTSYSTDFDPRLFADFVSPEGDDAVLVIFNVERFLQQALPHLNEVAPLSDKRLHQIEYYDAYHPPQQSLSPLTVKDMRFAYQREWRMIIDPGGREVLASGGELFVNIGSIADIAAVYAPDGSKIAGTGPESFLA